MTGVLYQDPVRAIVGATIYPGASLTVYDQASQVASIYAEPEAKTPLSNPLTADAAGFLPPIYVATFSQHFSCVLTSAAGAEIFDSVASLGPLSVTDATPRDASGNVMPLATRTFFAARTTVLATIYSDAAMETEAVNPQTASEAGEFSPVYLDGQSDYRVVLQDGNRVLQYDLNTRITLAPVLSASQSQAGAVVDLSWTAAVHPVGIDEYEVYVSVNDGAFSLLGTVTALTFEDDAHYLDGDDLVYYVRAIAGDDGIDSNEAELTYEALFVVSNEVLFPWNTDAVADPRNALGAYEYYTGSASPIGGTSGGVIVCGDVGSTVAGGGPYSSFSAAVSALNAEWESEYAGNRSYSATPLGYSSSRSSSNGTVNDAANAASHPGALTSDYRRYNWLHLPVVGAEPVYIGSIDAQFAEGFSNNTAGYVAAHDGSSNGYVFIIGPGGGSWTGQGLTALCWKSGASTADGFHQTAETAFGGQTCGSSTGVAAYACAIVRAEIKPAPPNAISSLVSGTFKVLQQFLAASGTAQASVPQKLPLNPCLRSTDPNYSEQSYWEAEYDAAVTAGTMAAGKTYGTDYPVAQSWAYEYQVWL